MKRHSARFYAFIIGYSFLPAFGLGQFPALDLPSGFGINIHFTGDVPDLDSIAAAGIKVIRQDLGWEAIERTRGVYNFAAPGYDALVSGCQRRGIRLYLILDYSNILYETDRSVTTDSGRAAFARFARAAATHYANRNFFWEIWNEPNISLFWSPAPNATDYVRLVAIAAPEIHAADPSGIILATASSTMDFTWQQSCFQLGLLNHIDGVSVHPYRPGPPESVASDYTRLRGMIQTSAPPGKNLPVVSGEWGYSNLNWDNAILSDSVQAQYLIREFLINLYQQIPVSIWYDWKNDGTDPTNREHNFGIVENNLQPKTATFALRTLTGNLSGYRIESRMNLGDTNDYAFVLRNGQSLAWAFWTMNTAHSRTLPSAADNGRRLGMLGDSNRVNWTSTGYAATLRPTPQYMLLAGTYPLPLRKKAQRPTHSIHKFGSHRIEWKGRNLRGVWTRP